MEAIDLGLKLKKDKVEKRNKAIEIKKILARDKTNKLRTYNVKGVQSPPRKIIRITRDGKKEFVHENNPHTVNRNVVDIENNIDPYTRPTFKTNKREIKKIAVLLHLFYIDLWSEIQAKLSFISEPFDLYVNLVEDSGDYSNLIKMKRKIELQFPTAKVFISDNRGLDIGGTLTLIKYILNAKLEYDLILKIHGKKSIHSATAKIGTTWRNELYKSVLGSEKLVNKIITSFKVDDSIGMIGSKIWKIYAKNNKKLAIALNEQIIKKYSLLLNIHTRINDLEFIGGSIFWVDGHIFLNKFKGVNLNNLRNNLEFGSFTDHRNPTNTHAFERIFGLIVLDVNKKIIGI